MNATQLVECFPNILQSLGSIPPTPPHHRKLGVVVHAGDLRTWEVEAGGY